MLNVLHFFHHTHLDIIRYSVNNRTMVDYLYDRPTKKPQESPHWQALDHQEGDLLIHNLEELKQLLSSELSLTQQAPRLALWSCLLGYCEALCTHKQSRYSLYPIPLSALERLVVSEFTPPATSDTHRAAAQAVANWVWSKVASKSNSKDELHANSLYIALRGRIDGKSVDCFGAALVTVIGLRQLGFEDSILTLSEDHAYESHPADAAVADNNSNANSTHHLCTCEVAIPGNTKAQKAKRGQEVAKTFAKSQLSPQTSWLYMGMSPVYCRTAPMILAAALANLNCMIETNKQAKMELNSEPLLQVKRELLWILKDAGHIASFPFALCELGFSEEHCTSPRGDAMVTIPDLAPVPVTTIESLYHEAILCSQTQYDDRQVYPFCYMGYYHKDGGQDEEYRFGVALKYFYHAARVASRYSYEWGDTLQLTKVMTKISEFVAYEIWSTGTGTGTGTTIANEGSARVWKDPQNALVAAQWMLAFFDALLVWEERTNDRFLPILESSHKSGITKVFSLVSHDIRVKSFADTSSKDTITDVDTRPALQSARLQGTLGEALRKPKVSISDLHLTIIAEGGRRRRKRKES